MPWFVCEYFNNKKLLDKTIRSYERDFLVFFEWLLQEKQYILSITKITLSDINSLRLSDANKYINYLQNEQPYQNKKGLKQSSVVRKISSISSLFHYLANVAEHDNEDPYIERNIFSNVERKYTKDDIEKAQKRRNDILLTAEEVADFLCFIRSKFELFSKNQKQLVYYLKNKERDTAIISLLLGSGIRASELISIKLKQIELNNNIIYVSNANGAKRKVTITSIAKTDLASYLKVRKERYNASEHLTEVFLVNYRQAKPMSLRSIQILIKKYAEAYGKEGLSAQNLRHSFATRIFNRTNSLDILENELGQTSINPLWIQMGLIEDIKS